MSVGFSSDHHQHLMYKENPFDFPTDFPYEFSSTYSTESESDDEEIASLTRPFSRSVSLREPLFNFKVFSGLQESTIDGLGSSHSETPSPPPFIKGDEDAWNLIYAAAGQVARMKIRMGISNSSAGSVAKKSNSGVIGEPNAFDYPHRSPWERSDGVQVFRQQHFCRNRGVNAWPPPQVQNLRLHHCTNQLKPVLHGSGGGCDGSNTAAKRECTGTGVFLPRRYCDIPPESRKRQAGMIQSSTKSFVPITTPPQLQAHINGELLVGRKKSMILAAQQQQRSNMHGGVMELGLNNPAVLLPEEWTY